MTAIGAEKIPDADISATVAGAAAGLPRRIALVCDWCLPRFGGLELQLIGAARALCRAGHSVEIITSFPGPEVIDGVPVHRLPGLRMPFFDFTSSPRQFTAFRSLLAARAYDVVHVHAGVIAPLAYGAALISARAGLPTVVTFHSVYDYLLPALRALARTIGVARLPIAWTAVSRYVADEVEIALSGAPVSILPNGIDLARWPAVRGDRASADFRVVSVMRLQVRKRPLALFDIVDDAQRRLGSARRITLDIVGDGRAGGAVRRRTANRSGVTAQVRLHGRQPHDAIRALLARSDAFLLPTRLEAFGIAALEARCAGLPVVARRNTGVEDFIEHGVNGLFGDTDAALADALASLAENPTLLARITAANGATRPPYDWPEVVRATLAQYDRATALQAEAHRLAH